MTTKDGINPHLVYVRHPGGVTAQVWHEMDYGVSDWKRAIVVGAPRPLTPSEAALPIRQLMGRYPPLDLTSQIEENNANALGVPK